MVARSRAGANGTSAEPVRLRGVRHCDEVPAIINSTTMNYSTILLLPNTNPGPNARAPKSTRARRLVRRMRKFWMSTRRNNPWLRVGLDAWLLTIEASSVIALRMLKATTGGAAAKAEASRMVNEKIEAGLALQAKAMTGELGPTAHGAASRVISHYRRKVKANRRRLVGPHR
jgi:hypothetical protein